MAHFAELDENNVVLRVIVVANKDTSDENGVEQESIGIAFCQNLLGGRWIQTSYNNNIRKKYAGIGDTYNAQLDAFIAPPEYDYFVFDEVECKWVPPEPKPGDGHYVWDHDNRTWIELNIPDIVLPEEETQQQ